MKRRTKIVIGIAGVVALYFGAAFASATYDESRRSKLEAELAAALQVGDPAARIEHVLRKNGVSAAYEPAPFSRYAAVIRTGWLTNSGMLVYVDVDSDKKMKKVSVRNFYTGI